MDRSFYVEVEQGKHSVSIDRILEIATALQVAPSVLFDGVQ